MEQRDRRKRQKYRIEVMKLTGKARVLGVFGHPVGHSLSPAMHNAAIEHLGLDYIYVPFDVAPENLRQAVDGIRALGIAGVNVTVPHKEAVIPFLDEVEADAREVGSVNTIVNKDGRLTGASTDGAGFMRSLTESGFAPRGCRAVVLGSGGAGRAVAFALARDGAEVALFDAVPGKAEKLALDVGARNVRAIGTQDSALAVALESADLLVNCTPVGMHPNEDSMPVPAESLRPDLFVYDVVYNPLRTKLIQAAETAGASTMSGVKMLVYQGAVSFAKWTGIDPPTDMMEQAVRTGLRRDELD